MFKWISGHCEYCCGREEGVNMYSLLAPEPVFEDTVLNDDLRGHVEVPVGL